MMPVPWTEIDEVWGKLVHGILGGAFGEDLGVLFIRVHGRSDPVANPHRLFKGKVKPNATISVKTDDWTSEENSMEVAKVIRSLGIEYNLRYKPDIYSKLEIFRNNVYNIRPSIYYYE
jgi:hypothetical protein